MAIARVAQGNGAAGLAAFSGSWSANNLIILNLQNTLTATTPSIPSGYTNISSASDSTNSHAMRMVYIYAAGGDTMPTLTNATSVSWAIYSGVALTSPVVQIAGQAGASSSMSSSGIVSYQNPGADWVIIGATGKPITGAIGSHPPTSMTLVTEYSAVNDDNAFFDSNTPLSSYSFNSKTLSASVSWITKTFELVAAAGGSTITKNQTSVARIANNLTSTQTTTARIANTVTKTQTSISRIAKTVTKTQSSIARIATIVTKTQSATARVAVNLTKTQSATAHIVQAGTVTATQTAKARIATTVTATQTAKARMANNLTKTQTSTARISQIYTKTQTSIARIAIIGTKTQSSTARIQRTVNKTQTATARIAVALAKTQTSVARVAQLYTKTQSSIARIAILATKTQTAKARIANNQSKTQTSVARIASVLTRTQSSTARIAKTVSKTQTATARIGSGTPLISTIVDSFPGTSLSAQWVSQGDGVTVGSGVALLNGIFAGNGYTLMSSAAAYDLTNSSIYFQYIASTGSGSPNVTFNLSSFGVSGFGELTWKIKPGSGWTPTDANNYVTGAPSITPGTNYFFRIRNTGGTGGTVYWDYSTDAVNWTTAASESAATAGVTTMTLTVNFYLSVDSNNASFTIDNVNTFSGSKTQTATARIANSLTKTQSSVARIAKNITKTQSSVARIAQVYTKTQTSTARLAGGVTRTQTSTARIQRTVTKTQTSVARIANIVTKTQQSKARISNTPTKTQSATARIQRVVTKTQTAVARIQVALATTQTATARVVQLTAFTKTQTSVARIANTFSKLQTATALIIQTPRYVNITQTVTSSSTAIVDSSQTNIADVNTGGTIVTVASPTNHGQIDR